MVGIVAAQHADRVDGRGAAGKAGRAGGVVVAAGVAVAAAAVLALHVLGAGRVDPVALTVSDYVSVPGGQALLGLAAGGLATAGAVLARSAARPGRPGAVPVLLGLWCAALAAVALFPTNVPGAAPDAAAVVHRWAGAVVFAVPPLAGLLAARRPAGSGHRPSRALWRWSAGTGAAVLAFLLAHAPAVLAGGAPFALLGLVERVTYLAMFGLLVVFGRCLAPGAPGPVPAGPRVLR